MIQRAIALKRAWDSGIQVPFALIRLTFCRVSSSWPKWHSSTFVTLWSEAHLSLGASLWCVWFYCTCLLTKTEKRSEQWFLPLFSSLDLFCSVLSQYGVHSFPILVVHNRTSRVRYHGSRTLENFVSFYQNYTGEQFNWGWFPYIEVPAALLEMLNWTGLLRVGRENFVCLHSMFT